MSFDRREAAAPVYAFSKLGGADFEHQRKIAKQMVSQWFREGGAERTLRESKWKAKVKHAA